MIAIFIVTTYAVSAFRHCYCCLYIRRKLARTGAEVKKVASTSHKCTLLCMNVLHCHILMQVGNEIL